MKINNTNNTSDNTMNQSNDSFSTRVKTTLFKDGPLKPPMRRPLMMLALFEANRIISSASSLNQTGGKNNKDKKNRPFQRKIVLLSTAMDLIYSLDFLTETQKLEVIGMTRKVDSKPVLAKLAFQRGDKLIEEVENKFLPGMKQILSSYEGEDKKTHEEACEEFIQMKFEEATGKKAKEMTARRPPFWEMKHMPLFIVYCVYYRGWSIDEELFATAAPREAKWEDLPERRPENMSAYVYGNWSPVGSFSRPFAGRHLIGAPKKEMPGADGNTKGFKKQGSRKNKNICAVMQTDAVSDGDVAKVEADTIATSPNANVKPKFRTNKMIKAGSNIDEKITDKNIMQLLLQIKTRMEILKEIEAEQLLPEKRILNEKKMLLRALPLIHGKAGEHSRIHLMEAKLRMELLKEMKDIMPPKKFGNQMKKLFLGLPTLPVPRAMQEAKKAKGKGKVDDEDAKMDGVEEMKYEVFNKDKIDGAADGGAIDEAWEEVDDIATMDAGVSEIEIA